MFMTIPVYRMGQLTLYDAWNSVNSQRDMTSFSLDDVDAVFDHVTQLKYSQHYSVGGTWLISNCIE